MNFQTKLFRYWYYFRIGYSTYLTWPISLSSTIIIFWGLWITFSAKLKGILVNIYIFGIAFSVAMVIASIFFGFIHFKRTKAFSSEADIAVESNPWFWKSIGKEREIFVPAWAIILHALAEGKLTPEMQVEAKHLEDKLRGLYLTGDYRGNEH